MRTILWGKTFARAYKRTLKKYPSTSKDIEDTLRLLANEPFAPQLETHKLKGKWGNKNKEDLERCQG